MKDTLENILLFGCAGLVFYTGWALIAYLNL